jgi:hypothetical protein
MGFPVPAAEEDDADDIFVEIYLGGEESWTVKKHFNTNRNPLGFNDVRKGRMR